MVVYRVIALVQARDSKIGSNLTIHKIIEEMLSLS